MMPGFHFGAVTCYPCRAFFRSPFFFGKSTCLEYFTINPTANNPSRRVPERKTGATCTNFGKCILNPSALKHCPGCRFQKCLRWKRIRHSTLTQLFLPVHYWLRPIKRGQFKFANFAPHFEGTCHFHFLTH